MMPDLDKVFTKNEAVVLMHKDAASSYRLIAAHVEEHNYNAEQIIEWLRELADEAEAQIVVVELRDILY
jgi:DTW domain-containing protein YfiP